MLRKVVVRSWKSKRVFGGLAVVESLEMGWEVCRCARNPSIFACVRGRAAGGFVFSWRRVELLFVLSPFATRSCCFFGGTLDVFCVRPQYMSRVRTFSSFRSCRSVCLLFLEQTKGGSSSRKTFVGIPSYA